jgi:hypothetical protein
MYKHWRYRPAKADRPYPFYANFSRAFDDMLQGDKAPDAKEENATR